MKKLTRFALTALGSAAFSLSAYAADGVLEEVVVTAQKREQNILEVPISVATKSGREYSALFDAGADVRALSAKVPGLYIESSNGRVAPRFYIRGLGNIDFDLAASQPVSVIMDDVVMENVILKSFPLFDIERVEVSRGPQGSLFGRNTTAGIVKLVSRKPTTEFDAYTKVSAGTLGALNFEGAIGGGLGDNAAVRFSYLYNHRNNWIDNVNTGENEAMGGLDEKAFRAQLMAEPNEDVSFSLSLQYRDLEGTASVFRANVFDAGSNALNSNFDRDKVYFDEGDNNPQEYDSVGLTAKVDINLGSTTLTSISSFNSAKGRSLGDIDGGFGAVYLPTMGPGFIPFNSATQDSVDDLEQITQEFRLASADDSDITWQVGAFYFTSGLTVTTNPFFAPPTTVIHNNDAFALFGQMSMDLSETLTLTAGLRYTDDEKDFSAPGFVVKAADDQISGDLAVSFALNEDTTLYSRYAQGFKAPTIQGRDVAFFGAPSVANSETSDSFEVGFKTNLMNGRGQLSGALYSYQVQDIQFSAVGGAANSIQLVNAKEGTGQGFELEGKFLVGDNFEVTGGYAYNNTEINDAALRVGPCGSGQCTVLDTVDASGFALVDGNPFPNAPEVTFNMTAEAFMPFGNNAELFTFVDWGYQGKTNIFLYESAEFQTDDQWEMGLQAGYRKVDGSWEILFFGRNITDEENVQGAIDFNNNTGFVNEPRVFGVQMTARFQ